MCDVNLYLWLKGGIQTMTELNFLDTVKMVRLAY